ncbi:unnamed protein product [Ranitomeya imitator]|uniref:Reverse transcriptase domain-containing protein n=1 Tax=Ranitomeya imitator TaxID=111125 RepID=A0ABN9L1N8_9NEOB|nr:unnamed protein product [Ranitomeya imitator]
MVIKGLQQIGFTHQRNQFNLYYIAIEDIAKESNTNPKLFFNYINSKRIKTENVGPLKNSEERMVVDDEEKANILNTFFSTVFTVENEMLALRREGIRPSGTGNLQIKGWYLSLASVGFLSLNREPLSGGTCYEDRWTGRSSTGSEEAPAAACPAPEAATAGTEGFFRGKKKLEKRKNKSCPICDKALPVAWDKKLCKSCIQRVLCEETPDFASELKNIIRSEVQNAVSSSKKGKDKVKETAQSHSVRSSSEDADSDDSDSSLSSSEEDSGRHCFPLEEVDALGHHVRIFSDNKVTVAYINHQGGTRSQALMSSSAKIFNLAEENRLSLSALHIQGSNNERADYLSRSLLKQGEWSLNHSIYDQITKIHSESQRGQSENDPHSPVLAKKDVVLLAEDAFGLGPMGPAEYTRPSTSRADLPPTGIELTFDSLVFERRLLKERGFSDNLVTTLLKSRKPITTKIYGKTWKKFLSVSKVKVQDGPSIPKILEFLQKGLEQGLSGPRKGFRASKGTLARWIKEAIVLAYSSSGNEIPDGIRAHSTRAVATSWAERDSIASGSVPQDWRIANVVPIFKKGSKSEPGNYRPLSLTSIVGKIFEGFLKDVILDYLNENNCLTPYQHGFMRNRSCQTNLISFYEEVSYRLDHVATYVDPKQDQHIVLQILDSFLPEAFQIGIYWANTNTVHKSVAVRLVHDVTSPKWKDGDNGEVVSLDEDGFVDANIKLGAFPGHQKLCQFSVSSMIRNGIQILQIEDKTTLINNTSYKISYSPQMSVPQQLSDDEYVPAPDSTVFSIGPVGEHPIAKYNTIPCWDLVSDNSHSTGEPPPLQKYMLLSLCHNAAAGSPECWSLPAIIRLEYPRQSVAVPVGECAGNDLCTKALVLTYQEHFGVTYITLTEDPSPRMIVRNRCRVSLLLKENIKETPKFEVYCRKIPAECSVHHEMYHQVSSFPDCKTKDSLPGIYLKVLPCEEPTVEWSDLIDINNQGTQVVFLTGYGYIYVDVVQQCGAIIITLSPEGRAGPVLTSLNRTPCQRIVFKSFITQLSVGIYDDITNFKASSELMRLNLDNVFLHLTPVASFLRQPCQEMQTDLTFGIPVFYSLEVYCGDLQIDNQLYSKSNFHFPVLVCQEEKMECSRWPKAGSLSMSTKELEEYKETSFCKLFITFSLEQNVCDLNELSFDLRPSRLYVEDTLFNGHLSKKNVNFSGIRYRIIDTNVSFYSYFYDLYTHIDSLGVVLSEHAPVLAECLRHARKKAISACVAAVEQPRDMQPRGLAHVLQARRRHSNEVTTFIELPAQQTTLCRGKAAGNKALKQSYSSFII